MFELMIDGADAQLAVQRAKDTFDLRQLHVTGPQDCRIFAGEIAAQQIMAVTLFGGLELHLVGMKRESGARDGFVFLRHLDLHEPKGAARLFFREDQPTRKEVARSALAKGSGFGGGEAVPT